ncbi:MAG TPA: FxLYD domain-containing protein [Thermoanaerobaculia bacterium]|nr:FxLYD domain-containing protein [Thermoanaerobaculia bacterium]
MSLAGFVLILFQVAAAAPGVTPTPTPTPTVRGLVRPRTLQDVARERRLKTGSDAKGSVSTITVGPAPGATPGATPSASPAASGDAPAGDAPIASDVRVVEVSNDGVVDPGGVVRVSGTVRNGGDQTVCGVAILVRILDSKGNYLASAQAAPDVNILPARETSSFHANVQAPPGVRGARMSPNRRDVTDGSTTMAGDWKLLGGAEAKVVDASACAK